MCRLMAAQLALAVSEHQRFGYCVNAQIVTTQYQKFRRTTRRIHQRRRFRSRWQFREYCMMIDPFRLISGTLQGDSCSTTGDVIDCGGYEQCIDGYGKAAMLHLYPLM